MLFAFLTKISSDYMVSRYWIGSLFDTFFPPFFRLGNFSNLDFSLISEAPKALSVLKTFCSEILFWPSHSAREPKMLSTAYQVIRLAFYLDNKHAYPAISRSPMNDLFRAVPEYCRRIGDASTAILPELAATLSGAHSQGIMFGMVFIRCVKTVP